MLQMIYACPVMDGDGYDYHIHIQIWKWTIFLGLGFRSNDTMIDF